MRIIKFAFRLAVLLFFFSSCGSKTEVSEESAFWKYISAYTSGHISRHAAIRLQLADEVSDAEAGKEVSGDVFEFSPKIKGTPFWIDSRTIEFRPDEPLKGDQEYTARFHLSKFREVEEKGLETFVFNFKTIKQAINVAVDYPVISDSGELILNGELRLTDKDDLGKLQKTLSLRSDDFSNLQIEWKELRPGVTGYSYHFSILGATQGEQEKRLFVRYDGTSIDAENKGEEEIVIPVIQGLQLVGHKVINGEEAHIQLYFNAPLQAKQDLKSLFYFPSGENVTLTFVQEGSMLKIYPSKIFFESKQLTINKNLRSIQGSMMEDNVQLSVSFESIKPEIRLVGKGVILPGAQGITIPFLTVSLRAVDVYVLKIFENNVFQFLQGNQLDGKNEMKRVARPVLKKTIKLDNDKLVDLTTWNMFSLDLSELIRQEPGAIYRVVFRMKKSYSIYPCSNDAGTDAVLDGKDRDLEEWDKSTYWSSYYYDEDYDYNDFWNNVNEPCHPAYYSPNHRSVETNILASNLGIIAKAGENNKFFAAVTNLLTTDPESDAEVIFYNYQQQAITSGKTDGKGFIEIPLNIKPYFLEVRKGNQRGYLRLDDGSSLSLSNFDVSGAEYKKGLKGFIYGERGVWRPGDTLHVTFIIQDEDKALPKEHPITMEFWNPRNQLYSKQMQKYNESVFYVFQIPTTNDVPTGQWDMKIRVGGSLFSKSFWIETVKPNRLKINLEVNTDVIRAGSVPRFTLQSAWLHGAKASNKQADVKVKYRKSKTSFPDYKEFIFDSPLFNEFTSEEKVIFEGKTDAEGTAIFTREMPKATNAPGMLQADFTTRVFEGEGDFSVNYKTIEFSPYSAYVGLRVPKAQNTWGILYTDKSQTFDIVLVDEKGKPTDSNNLEFTMYRLDWRWWWDGSGDNNLAYYINNEYAKQYLTRQVLTSKGKASVTVEVPNGDWGRYLVCVKDKNGKHLTGTIVFFDWEDWLGRSSKDNPSGATMLTFTTDKEKYSVGDKVKVTIPSSQKGRALVTVENRSRIISAQWIEASGSNSTFEMEVTREMSPNVYIYVTFLQPHSNTGNDLPIRLYGVKNIMVDDKNSHLYPTIKMPDVLEPEKEFTVNVSEKEGKEMTYTLAIVDEGLLDLTNFKTPDPHPNFYIREALGINTWDMFNYVIGAYGGKIEQLFAIGGDMSMKSNDEDKTNSRFKPVVKFIGPFTLKAGKTNTHKITLPSYFGSVRTMVVAGNANAYGNAEKTVKVQKPLMVMATLPRVAGPNEEISLPVNVFAMEDKIKDVTVTVSSGNLLKPTGPTSQKLSFEKAGDQVVTFQLKAANTIGKETVKVKAVSGSKSAEYEIILEVRNPNPRVTETQSIILQAGEKKDLTYQLPGSAGTNTLTLEVSRIPSLNLEKRLGYLIGYPHGCAEQTTSKGFPQLFLPALMSLSSKEAAESEQNVKSTIQKLTQMQRSDGAVLYWLGGSYTYDWVTTYAGHFMIEARDRGYNVPASFLSRWAEYQKQQALAWSASKNNTQEGLEQAYILYTLALYGKPEPGAMNRLRETANLSPVAAWRLAAAYALDGKPEVAQKLIAGLPVQVENYSAFNSTFGSSLRDHAMILETLVLLKDHERALKQAQLISKQLNDRSWYSTQTTAYALLAMSKFATLTKADKNIQIAYDQDGDKKSLTSKEPVLRAPLNAEKRNGGTVSIANRGEGTIFVDLTQAGIPIEDNTPEGSNGMTMTIQYTDPSGNPINVETLQQGVDFLAHVTIQNTSTFERYNEISLTQIFPSGWEILNDRMQNGPSANAGTFSYQDIRDDRVLTYFSLDPSKKKQFVVQLHAAYAGKFFLPATLCEAMYDNKIFARNQGRWVNVVK
jgi:uncharacterized protein YfaS (alpha-2-macroglobulin family)